MAGVGPEHPKPAPHEAEPAAVNRKLTKAEFERTPLNELAKILYDKLVPSDQPEDEDVQPIEKVSYHTQQTGTDTRGHLTVYPREDRLVAVVSYLDSVRVQISHQFGFVFTGDNLNEIRIAHFDVQGLFGDISRMRRPGRSDQREIKDQLYKAFKQEGLIPDSHDPMMVHIKEGYL